MHLIPWCDLAGNFGVADGRNAEPAANGRAHVSAYAKGGASQGGLIPRVRVNRQASTSTLLDALDTRDCSGRSPEFH
jgi:hypothetical protein